LEGNGTRSSLIIVKRRMKEEGLKSRPPPETVSFILQRYKQGDAHLKEHSLVSRITDNLKPIN
jgi:hypothetical protein